MAQETKKYNEDYLNGLIAKAKKSWEGVDVDSYMSNLRDEEDAEKEQARTHSDYTNVAAKQNINTNAKIIKLKDEEQI